MIAVALAYLPLLLLTLALECAVVAGLARGARRQPALMACIALNLFTHPTATAMSWHFDADVLVLELAVILVEWLGYSKLLVITSRSALGLALVANLLSAAAGVALWLAQAD